MNSTARSRLKVAYEMKVKHYAMEKLAKAAGIDVSNGNFKSTMQSGKFTSINGVKITEADYEKARNKI